LYQGLQIGAEQTFYNLRLLENSHIASTEYVPLKYKFPEILT